MTAPGGFMPPRRHFSTAARLTCTRQEFSRSDTSDLEEVPDPPIRASGLFAQGPESASGGVGVTAIVGFGKGLGEQWYVNVGFLLDALGTEPPVLVERSHLYFRLDRLAPDLRETLLTAGCLDDPRQEEAHSLLIQQGLTTVDLRLRALSSVHALRAELTTLDGVGLVTREAREYLT
jgi:hypothetical protein